VLKNIVAGFGGMDEGFRQWKADRIAAGDR
jgi:hypothetical protein